MTGFRLFVKKEKNIAALILFFIAMWIAMKIAVSGFGTVSQFTYIMQQAAFLGIACIGQNLIVLTGGIDLSPGYMITFAGIFLTVLHNKMGVNFVASFILCLLVLALLGLFNGLGVAKLRIPPMVMTLAVGTMIQGLSLLVSGGFPSSLGNASFSKWVGTKTIFGVSNVTLLWIILIIAVTLLLTKTTLGKSIYYVGSNPLAAKFCGINVSMTLIKVYVLSAVFCGLAGIVLVGFTSQSTLNMGDSYLFTGVTAVVLGGTSVAGGKGNYVGTAVGCLILTLLTSALTMMGIPDGGQTFVKGVVLVVLVILYGLASRKKQ